MQTIQRRIINVRGVVQGVGFRPFIYHLAEQNNLCGFVRNASDGVHIEAQGAEGALEQFIRQITSEPPPLARVESLHWRSGAPQEEAGFRICPSERSSETSVSVSPDIATCDECLAELFDPKDRRYLYPFINCTNCGPRFTIITGLPYDRPLTTMAPFALCAECRAEYEDPGDRRFHAEPVACPRCGPRLHLLDGEGQPMPGSTPIGLAAEFLRMGRTVALKGLGGFHLACDATNEGAVDELRRRKARDEKPLAVMVADVRMAESLCELTREGQRLLQSPERPIVLLRRKPGAGIAPSVAPGNPHLGLMLPYTALHHLLIREMRGGPVVMTSGNRSDEPIVFRDEEMHPRLRGAADSFLTHDRTIHFRCDDSVVSGVGEYPILLRRSRGYSPSSLKLPVKCTRRILALGGHLKATFGFGRDDRAIVSHHLGDLDDAQALLEYTRSIAHYERLFDFTPEVIAHDLHPDYASSRYADERSGDFRRVAVQHHHAHMAACMAEHGLVEPVIGVTFDGTGYGVDGTVWGGEFLVGDYSGFTRAAHLRCVRMPGGERAVREPWRMALAHLIDAEVEFADLLKLIPNKNLRTVRDSLRKGINAPWTSSCGRLLDAAQAVIGRRSTITYEGQAAMELEWAATNVEPCGAYPYLIAPGDPLVIDTRPLIRALASDVRSGIAPNLMARRVHSTLAEIVLGVCVGLREKFAIQKVVLSGGVFMNCILLQEARMMLAGADFEVFSHRQVPANDGGLCLGQLAIAACTT